MITVNLKHSTIASFSAVVSSHFSRVSFRITLSMLSVIPFVARCTTEAIIANCFTTCQATCQATHQATSDVEPIVRARLFLNVFQPPEVSFQFQILFQILIPNREATSEASRGPNLLRDTAYTVCDLKMGSTDLQPQDDLTVDTVLYGEHFCCGDPMLFNHCSLFIPSGFLSKTCGTQPKGNTGQCSSHGILLMCLSPGHHDLPGNTRHRLPAHLPGVTSSNSKATG